MRHRTVLLVALGHAERVPLDDDSEENACKIKVTLSTVACMTSEMQATTTVSSDRRKWLALALLCVVQFMVVLDIAIVNVALPSIQIDLGFSQERPPVGHQRLRPRLRRVPAARRPGRRHAGPPPDLPRRDRRVHRRLAARRAGLVRGLADRRPRLPGPRRGDHHAGRAVDPLHDVPRGPRAQHRARRLGRRRRLRCRGRRAARRRPHRRPQLGVDLLRQRPGRRRRLRRWRRSCSRRAATPASRGSTCPAPSW